MLEDEQGRREIGTRAAVVEVLQVFDDGRMNVVVEGHDRFRLRELTSGREFLTGEVEPRRRRGGRRVRDRTGDRALSLFRRLVEAVGEDIDEPDGGSGSLSFEIAARVDFGIEPKQELLELLSEPERLRQLCELLEAGDRGRQPRARGPRARSDERQGLPRLTSRAWRDTAVSGRDATASPPWEGMSATRHPRRAYRRNAHASVSHV